MLEKIPKTLFSFDSKNGVREIMDMYIGIAFQRIGCQKWECKTTITTTELNLEIKDENFNHVDHPNFS